jgi:hypothetical protein
MLRSSYRNVPSTTLAKWLRLPVVEPRPSRPGCSGVRLQQIERRRRTATRAGTTGQTTAASVSTETDYFAVRAGASMSVRPAVAHTRTAIVSTVSSPASPSQGDRWIQCLPSSDWPRLASLPLRPLDRAFLRVLHPSLPRAVVSTRRRRPSKRRWRLVHGHRREGDRLSPPVWILLVRLYVSRHHATWGMLSAEVMSQPTRIVAGEEVMLSPAQYRRPSVFKTPRPSWTSSPLANSPCASSLIPILRPALLHVAEVLTAEALMAQHGLVERVGALFQLRRLGEEHS